MLPGAGKIGRCGVRACAAPFSGLISASMARINAPTRWDRPQAGEGRMHAHGRSVAACMSYPNQCRRCAGGGGCAYALGGRQQQEGSQIKPSSTAQKMMRKKRGQCAHAPGREARGKGCWHAPDCVSRGKVAGSQEGAATRGVAPGRCSQSRAATHSSVCVRAPSEYTECALSVCTVSALRSASALTPSP